MKYSFIRSRSNDFIPIMLIAVLIYLEQQGIVNVNWDKLQGILSTIVSTVTTGGVGGNHKASLLPATTMMTNLGIPLTGSMAAGFAIGFLRSCGGIQMFSLVFLRRKHLNVCISIIY